MGRRHNNNLHAQPSTLLGFVNKYQLAFESHENVPFLTHSSRISLCLNFCVHCTGKFYKLYLFYNLLSFIVRQHAMHAERDIVMSNAGTVSKQISSHFHELV